MAQELGLTVRELVEEADLGLEVVTGEAGLDRAVLGIHQSDLEDPTPWMVSGTVLLTTGAAFARQPETATRYLDRLDEKGTVALCVGVGHYMEHAPAALVTRARELDIAILEAPLSVPFRRVVAYVYNAHASADMHNLRRSLAVQNRLLDLLAEERGIADVISTLAALLEMAVILFDGHGSAVAEAGTEDVGESERASLWRGYTEHADDLGPLGAVEAEGGRLYFRPIKVYGVVERVLAAISPQRPASDYADRALAFAQRLIMLDLLREREQFILRRRMRSLLLDDFLSMVEPGRDFLLRLEDQDVDVGAPWRVVVCDIDDFHRAVRRRARLSEKRAFEIKTGFINAVDRYLGGRGLPFLTMMKGDAILALVVFGERPDELVHEALTGLHAAIEVDLDPLTVTVGCSQAVVGLGRPAQMLKQAWEAVGLAREGVGVHEPVVLFDQAGARFRLLEGQSDEALRAIHERLIVPLEEHDRLHHTRLVQTLHTFVDNRLSVQHTADALFVHRNTLHKRLQRIEELLGIDFDSMDDVLEVYVGLRAAELVGSESPV